MGKFPIDESEQAKIFYVSQDINWHHDSWIVLLVTEMTWRCNVGVSQWMNMHARTTCVAEQAWIPHKQCSISKGKPHWRFDEVTKRGIKSKMGLEFPLKACCERFKITILHNWRSTTVTQHTCLSHHQTPTRMRLGCATPLQLAYSLARLCISI